MELHRQFGDLYGNDNRFCQFDEIKWDFIRNDGENSKSLKLFHQLLKMENGRKLNTTKKLLTINRECELIPYHREAIESIRLFEIGEKEFQFNSVDLLESNNCSLIFSVFYPFMVYLKDSELIMISLISGKQFFTHTFDAKYSIAQMELKFHSQLQQYYKSKLQIEGECYIYSLYIFGCLDNLSIKRFLLIDNLVDITLVEDCTFLNQFLSIKTDTANLKVCDWDANTVDAILLRHDNFLTIFLEDGFRFSFVILSDSKEIYNTHNNQHPIIPILFPKWTPGCVILDTSIVNITKPLMREGISLIDSSKYTAFLVFQVKICYHSSDENDESEIFCDSIYILLTKKYDQNLQSNPYSIMWKVCNRNGFESMFQINVRKIGIPTKIDYPVDQALHCNACFFDQGRKLQIHTNYYYDQVGLGTLVDFIKTYQTWRFTDSESIGEFEEYNLKNRITKALSTRNWKVIGHVEEHFYIVVNFSYGSQRYTMKVCVVNYDNIKKIINK